MAIWVLLLLPALAHCDLTVYIQTYSDTPDAWTDTQGTYWDLLTDSDRINFRLSEKVLMAAIDYLGDNDETNAISVRVTGPSPPDIQFNEAHRRVDHSRTINLFTKSEINVLGVQEFDGNEVSEVDLTVILGQVTNSMEAKWLQKDIFYIDRVIEYKVRGAFEFNVKSRWEVDLVEKKDLLVSAVPVADNALTLSPGQVVVVTLSTTKVTHIFLSDYKVYLYGNALADYPPGYYRYQQKTLNDILTYLRYPMEMKLGQLITLQYHIKGKVTVRDKVTNKTIAEHVANIV